MCCLSLIIFVFIHFVPMSSWTTGWDLRLSALLIIYQARKLFKIRFVVYVNLVLCHNNRRLLLGPSLLSFKIKYIYFYYRKGLGSINTFRFLFLMSLLFMQCSLLYYCVVYYLFRLCTPKTPLSSNLFVEVRFICLKGIKFEDWLGFKYADFWFHY